MEFEKAIAEAVQAAVNTEATKKFETRSNTKSAKAKNTTTTHEGAITGELVTLVITAIQPVLVKAMTAAVTTAVATASKQIMLELRHDLQTVECVRKEMETLRTQVQSQNFELDRLQQYSRRDNIRVYGIAEATDENENTNSVIVKVAKDMGVDISEHDLSVNHRLGRKAGTKPRPIIAKFVRRDTKTAIMRRKKNMRGQSGYISVFVNDDLTTLRSKLVYELKRDKTIKRVWTIDGRIMCIQEENGTDMKNVIDSPDDLFKVGWTEEKVAGLGVYSCQK